jgi:hypothetical protein
MKDPNDLSDLGAVPVADLSDLGAIPVEDIKKQSMLSKVGDTLSSLNDTVGGKVMDFGQGVANGASLGLLDEAGGALSALGESAYNKLNPTNRDLESQGFKIDQPGLPELYRKNQKMIQNELDEGEKRSPYLTAAGNIGGGMLTGGAVLGALGGAGTAAPTLSQIATNEGKLAALAKLGIRGAKASGTGALLGGVQGAANSKEGGILNKDEFSKLTDDTLSGVKLGAIAGPAMEVIGSGASAGLNKAKTALSNLGEDTPLIRQAKIAYDYGKNGVNLLSQKAKTATGLDNPTLFDNQRTTSLVKELQAADSTLGAAVPQSLLNSKTETVNISQDILDSLQQLQTSVGSDPLVGQNPKVKILYNKLLSSGGQATPTEAKQLLDYVNSTADLFKDSTNPTHKEILKNLFQTSKSFSNSLKEQVPEYAQAAERFAQFRQLVPETILAGSGSPELSGIGFGKITDKELENKIKPMLQGVNRSGAAQTPVRENFVQSMNNMTEFEKQEAQRLASGQISEPVLKRPVSAIKEQIEKFSDDAVARSSTDALNPHVGAGGVMKNAVTNMADTGLSMIMGGSNMAGRVVNSASKGTLVNLSRAAFNAPDTALHDLATNLQQSSSLKKYGVQLSQALQSPDQNRKNQVLFTILQNPSARDLMSNKTDEPQN